MPREQLSAARLSRAIYIAVFATTLSCGGSGGLAQGTDFNAAPPNARDQQPAFAQQTRAPVLPDTIPLVTTVIAGGLDRPWGIATLPEGGWLVTERGGQLRIISPQGAISAPITGLPKPRVAGQGGLLDVVISPNFATTPRIWWSYAEARSDTDTGLSVASGLLSADRRAVHDVQVIFRQEPAWASSKHFGSRLVFDADGALFITTGDRGTPMGRALAQDPATHIGKVLRILPEGGAAPGNPNLPGWQPEVWSRGHRNIQGATLGPDHQLWTIEHGARGGDELNHPQSGKNYGWPLVAYGEDYIGLALGQGLTAADGIEQPLYYWDPVIAPSGMAFYSGAMFPEWEGHLLIGALAGTALVRLQLDGTKVIGEARHLQNFDRIRDVEIAPDGSILILTDGDDGALIRLTRVQ